MLKHARKPKLKGRKYPTKKCKKAERLYGPVELDIVEHLTNGVRIVLLGDVHTSRKKCPMNTKCGVSIWSYLETLFQQYKSNEFLDFFLELPFADDEHIKGIDPEFAMQKKQQLISENTPHRNYLRSLHIYFYNCWQRVKSVCDYYRKPIRFHYSDVREGVVHSDSEFEDRLTIKLLRELLNIENDEVLNSHKHILITIIDKFIKRDINYLFRLSKIDKQLKGIKHAYIVTSLKEMMNDHITNVMNFAISAKSIAEEMLQKKSSIIIETNENEKAFFITNTSFFERADRIQFVELVHFVIGGLLSPLFDIYTLSRMIRLNMKRVIIYAGAMHTNRIKWFLVNRLGFRSKVSVVSKREDVNFQCINMKSVPQPWFS